MTDTETTVFIVDDDPAVRDSISLLVKSVYLPARTFATAEDFLEAYGPDTPGCLVLDVRLPGMSGLMLQGVLNERRATIPIIFISGYGDVPMAVQTIRHGAFDFLPKPFRDQDLLDRIQRAIMRDRQNRAVLEEHLHICSRVNSLTPRERDVLGFIRAGQTSRQIAQRLGVNHRTIEIHRAHIMQKTGAHSLAQLIRMVIDAEHLAMPLAERPVKTSVVDTAADRSSR